MYCSSNLPIFHLHHLDLLFECVLLARSQTYRVTNKQNDIKKRLRKLARDYSERVYAGREKIFQKKQQALIKELEELSAAMNRLGL